MRLEAFDNKNSDGDSYMKIDDMVAPRVGFSWDLGGDSRSKVFGNAGRYFLPVANVINIKQAGGLLDERRFYVFKGLQQLNNNGVPYQLPILGPRNRDSRQHAGRWHRRDLRGTVDRDLDPVYQDEFILGFQSMIDENGRGACAASTAISRTPSTTCASSRPASSATAVPNRAGFVMGNPGDPLTIFTDTNCDGVSDAFVTIDLERDGWASFPATTAQAIFSAISGFPDPKRTYKALEFVLDRAWDDNWSLNASYTLSYSEGQCGRTRQLGFQLRGQQVARRRSTIPG